MTALELVCGTLALSTALLLGFSYVAMTRSLMWRDRYMELIAKPFSFWEARERNRRLYEALSTVRLDSLAQVKAMPESDPDKVVQFRRPPPFNTPPL